MNQNKINDFKIKYASYYLMNKDDISCRQQTNDALLFSFFEMFGIEKLSNMKIDDYCFEKGNKNTFCYWFDYQLNDLCDIHIKKTGAFQKYHIQKNGNQYKFLKSRQKRNKFGSTYQEVFENVKKEIIKIAKASQILNDKNIGIIKNSGLHESFKAKLTYVYSADNWVPILVENDVNRILDWFGATYKTTDDLTSKRIELFNIYKDVRESGLSLSTWDFMRFFYNENGLRSVLRDNYVANTDVAVPAKKNNAIKKQNIVIRDIDSVKINHPTDIVISSGSYFESDDISTEEDFEKIERIKKRIGNEGERIVFSYLKKNKTNLGITNIQAPCFDGKNNLHYDISYVRNGICHYIEVKATCLSSIKTIYFEMSDQEYLFMSKHLKDGLYELFYVQNVFGFPTISVIQPKMIIDKLKTKSYVLEGAML